MAKTGDICLFYFSTDFKVCTNRESYPMEVHELKTQTKILPPEILLEEYRKLLQEENVKELPITVTGNSMSPFLVHGRDTVYLSRLNRPVCRGDVLLYRRDNGVYVLHRVFDTTSDGYTMVGDAQTDLEHGIRQEQIIAVVTRVTRKGKDLHPGTFWWDFFETVWLRLRTFRRPIHKLYTIIKK